MALYELRGVRQRYHHRTVLDLPTFHVEAGEFLAILGPSGASKSTLLRLLSGGEAPTEGTIAFDLSGGLTPLSALTLAQRRRQQALIALPRTGSNRIGLRSG